MDLEKTMTVDTNKKPESPNRPPKDSPEVSDFKLNANEIGFNCRDGSNTTPNYPGSPHHLQQHSLSPPFNDEDMAKDAVDGSPKKKDQIANAVNSVLNGKCHLT